MWVTSAYRQVVAWAKRGLRHIAEQKDRPESIAFGLAVGIFVGLTPTMGLQVVIAGLLATLCRANRVAAMSAVWITNVVTAFPIYFGTSLLGAALIGRPMDPRQLTTALRGALAKPGWAGKFYYMTVGLGYEFLLPMWIGGVVVGLIGAIATYPLAVRLIKGHRLVQSQKQRERLQREREAIAQEIEETGSGDAG